MRSHASLPLLVALAATSGLGCRDANGASALELPPGFPAPDVPEDNPVSAEKVELGRYLFYDLRLSANEEQSCAGCHEQDKAFSDGLAVALGSTGEAHPRNSLGLTNTAYNATLTWANPILTELESQILIPIFGEEPVELGVTGSEDEVLARFQDDARYQELFGEAFPGQDDPIGWENIVKALATFTRALISGDSPFDRYVYQDQEDALPASALRGMELFFSERLECHHCHGGFNFTESTLHEDSAFDAALFHNTGLYNVDGAGGYPADNTGVFEITADPRDMGRFRPPTLRNIEVTAPYMHDGSIASLEEVIDFYAAGGRLIAEGPNAGDGRTSPLKSGLVAGFSLTEGERDDLLSFLRSLTDRTFLEDPRFSNPFNAETP